MNISKKRNANRELIIVKGAGNSFIGDKIRPSMSETD
jgi:hypothetical protein